MCQQKLRGKSDVLFGKRVKAVSDPSGDDRSFGANDTLSSLTCEEKFLRIDDVLSLLSLKNEGKMVFVLQS